MKPLTELDLRMAMKDNPAPAYRVPRGTPVTPAAAEYLRQLRVELVYEDPAPAPDVLDASAAPRKPERPARKWDFSDPKAEAGEEPRELFFGPDGGAFDHKPEALTHLKGRQLVRKDHPVIIWRGKLDTLAARIVEAQVCAWQSGNREYVDDLQEILEFTRRLLASELRGREVEEWNLLGLNAADLRERSHDPVKFYGHPHMLATPAMGPQVAALNTLRALVREAELAAAAAFKDGAGQGTRDDLILALNRLSSLFYILMFKYLPPGFTPESSGI
jgi:ethanolamine utilization cobalamin adenosyltransferase